MQYKGFKPYSFQKEIIDTIINGDNFYTTLVCGRQIGKTLLLINVLLYYAINNPKSTILWVSPYYSMSIKVLTQILDAIEKSGIVKDANKSDKIITLINGSRIWFRSSEKPETIRGLSVNYAFLDEGQDISDSAVHKDILPTLTATGKKCIIAGTPKGKSWFYTFYMRGGDIDEPKYKSFNAPSSVSPYVSEEFLEEQKKSLPPAIFEQEYMAQFQASDGEVFSNIDGVCILDEWISNKGRTVAGLDVASKQDYAVLTIMDETGRVIWMYRERGMDYTQLVDKVVYYCNQYKSTLYVEANGVGDPIVEMIKKKYKDTHPFITTNTTKENIIRRLISDISDSTLELPSPSLFPPLYKELQMFQYKILPSGKIQYAAMSGSHDDTIMSLAICNWHRVTKPIRKGLVVGSIR